MREKKYRAYTEEYGFLYSDDYETLQGFFGDVGNSEYDDYTGLKDKNGKEIYEGDVVKIVSLSNDHHQLGSTEIMNVFYFMGNACVRWDDEETGTTIYPINVNHSFEIIGNIHQEQP